MTYLTLIMEFFKTGLFATGGGMATIPFLTDMADRYDWFTRSELTDMIAIAESTPGPIGVNAATYAGFSAAGIAGALTATLALITPSYIIILLISRALDKYRENPLVNGAFLGLRPAATGLIAAAAWSVIIVALSGAGSFGLSPSAVFLFALIMALTRIKTFSGLHPIVFIGAAAVFGILLKL